MKTLFSTLLILFCSCHGLEPDPPDTPSWEEQARAARERTEKRYPLCTLNRDECLKHQESSTCESCWYRCTISDDMLAAQYGELRESERGTASRWPTHVTDYLSRKYRSCSRRDLDSPMDPRRYTPSSGVTFRPLMTGEDYAETTRRALEEAKRRAKEE